MIKDDIETIESGYEFLLAYAAQGRPAKAETGPGPHARPTIEGIAAAMDNLQKFTSKLLLTPKDMSSRMKLSAEAFQKTIFQQLKRESWKQW